MRNRKKRILDKIYVMGILDKGDLDDDKSIHLIAYPTLLLPLKP